MSISRIPHVKDAVDRVGTTAELAAHEREVANLPSDQFDLKIQVGDGDFREIFVGQREQIEVVTALEMQGDRHAAGDGDFAGRQDVVLRVKLPIGTGVARGPLAILPNDLDFHWLRVAVLGGATTHEQSGAENEDGAPRGGGQ